MQRWFTPLFLCAAFFALVLFAQTTPALAQDTNGTEEESCAVDNRTCLLAYLRKMTGEIERGSWRDQTLRELAKTYAADGKIDIAISIIPDIVTPDTKAMTIRGIGMALADLGYSKEQNDEIFTRLRAAAEKIDHPPSYAIALTYIAMGQAFAGDNDGAWKTAADMENDALRHKAYAETAEIQAEHGDFESAMKSITYIESEAFRNKAYAIISKLLAERGHLDAAYKAALENTNAYKKAQSLQFILDKQDELKKEKAAHRDEQKDNTP